MATFGPFSFRRLRKLARTPGNVTFLQYVHAVPVQLMENWSSVGIDNAAAMAAAYKSYTAWCLRNGKEPQPKTEIVTNW